MNICLQTQRQNASKQLNSSGPTHVLGQHSTSQSRTLTSSFGRSARSELVPDREWSTPPLNLGPGFGHSFSQLLVDSPTAPRGRTPFSSPYRLPSGGLIPGVKPDREDVTVGGVRTMGEAIGDAGRVIGTPLGNAVGSIAGAVTGISVSSTSNTGPTWNNHGNFDWRVGFNTTGKNGWLVQEIVNQFRGEDSTGTAISGASITPRYCEAWAVDATSNITPNVGVNNDYWIRPSRGANTKGHWSMTGSVYFTTTDPATQGFTPGGVANAGILLSTVTKPSGLGVARLHRYAQGTWDSTGTTPTHTGSAGP